MCKGLPGTDFERGGYLGLAGLCDKVWSIGIILSIYISVSLVEVMELEISLTAHQGSKDVWV